VKPIICVGHAALDRIYRIDSFPPEPTKVRALEHVESGGGMAANAAATIAKLGGRAELWSRVGEDDAGVRIRFGLKAARVDARYVQSFEEGRSSTSAIIVDRRGERMIVGQRDANMPSGTQWLPLERIAGAAAVLCDLRWLEAVRTVFTRAREEGITTVLDADLGAREALGEILALTDYAIFAAPALADLVPGVDIDGQLQRVLSFGPRYVGVTQGAGDYLWREAAGALQRTPAFQVDVADTTGAGDAFHGAFTLALAEGQSLDACARFAAAAAALKCTRLGSRAGLPTRAELEAFMAGGGGG
jgi:sulfofructose kinase